MGYAFSNRLGTCLTDEHKSHLSQINSGENNPMFGKHHSAESRQKISDNLKGKMSGEKNPFYGKKHDEESLKKKCETIITIVQNFIKLIRNVVVN